MLREDDLNMLHRSHQRASRSLPTRAVVGAWPSLITACVLGATASGTLPAQPGEPNLFDEDAPPKATVALIAEHTALIAGEVNWLGLHFEMVPHWHIYWNGLNDTGFAPEARFTMPDGFATEAWEWPAPVRHIGNGDLLDHVYEGEVTLLVPVRVPADATGEATISAEVDWLVCDELCIPGYAEVSITLPVVTDRGEAKPSEHAPTFKAARKAIPTAAPSGVVDISPAADGFEVKVAGARELVFYPALTSTPLARPIKGAVAQGATLTLHPRERSASPDDSSESPRFRGVLEVRRSKDDVVWYTIDTGRDAPDSEEHADTRGRTRD